MAPPMSGNGFFTNPFQINEAQSSDSDSPSSASSSASSSSSSSSSDSDSDSNFSSGLNSSDEDIVRDLNSLRPAPSPRQSLGDASAQIAPSQARRSSTAMPPSRRGSNPNFRRSSLTPMKQRRHTEDDTADGESRKSEEEMDLSSPLPAIPRVRQPSMPRKSVSFIDDNTFANAERRKSSAGKASFEASDKSRSAASVSRTRQESVVDPLSGAPSSQSSLPSAPPTALAPPPFVGRRMSSFNPFDRDFAWSRRESQIAPNDLQNPRRSSFFSSKSSTSIISDKTLVDGVTPPQAAKLRTKSTGSVNRFKNPFGSDEDVTDINRRASAPMVRRPSQFQRMMSVVNEPNPIPKRYRSKSVSTLAFYMSSPENSNTTLPMFEEDIENQKENVQEYLAAVERQQAARVRKPWESHAFQGFYFFFMVVLVYFLVIGKPLWDGVAVLYYGWLRTASIGSLGCLVFLSWAALQCFLPLCGTFEQDVDDVEKRDASETALIIPAYKAAAVLPETIEAALKIFKPEQIFIVNNGNSPEPLDHTADVCKKYGVHHAWVPIGSKIVAEFVGVALTQDYKYIMLIDDDVHLPPNLPLVTNRIQGSTKCIGYTIKSTGANGIKGTYMQQCQDMEYKSSGMTRDWSGKYGSATFPHGAIILWETKTLTELFNVHPGYTISEDWYFGHAARSSGYRIEFCSQVFVETETPPNFIMNGKSDRGGFGEMTVYKQRFGRWNYFFVFRVWEDTIYTLFSWRLGWLEIVTKIFVVVEIYDSVMALLRPFVLVITAIAAWKLLLILTLATMGMYIASFVIFNAYHLRKKNEMVSWKILPMYMGMKFALMFVSCMSVYYGIWDYARFFKVRHSRVIENGSALEAAYKVRLGTKLVPLDAQLGDGLAHVTDDPDAIQPVMPAFNQGFAFGDTSEKLEKVTEKDLNEKMKGPMDV